MATYLLVIMGLSSFSIHAMQSSPQGQNDAVLRFLEVVENALITAQELQDGESLNVASARTFIQTAQSPWKYPAIWGIEKCITYSSDDVTRASLLAKIRSYPARGTLWLVGYLPYGQGAIDFCKDQINAGAPITNTLAMARYPQQHLTHILNDYEQDIDQRLRMVNPLLQQYGPALLDGLDAIKNRLEVEQIKIRMRENQARTLENQRKRQEVVEVQPQLVQKQKKQPFLTQLVNDDDDDNDQENPTAEYNRIYKECAGIDYLLNYKFEVALTNSIVSTVARREAEKREEGMTDWFK